MGTSKCRFVEMKLLSKGVRLREFGFDFFIYDMEKRPQGGMITDSSGTQGRNAAKILYEETKWILFQTCGVYQIYSYFKTALWFLYDELSF